MSSFTMPSWDPPCRISLTDGLTQDQLLSFPPFKTWSTNLKTSIDSQSSPNHAFHESPYKVHGIQVQAVDYFGGGERIGFVKLTTDVRNDHDEALPGSVLLRGGSVAMLILLQPDDVPVDSMEKYAIMTVQARVPIGSLSFSELPAGMLDDSDSMAGAAAREMEEETGIQLHRDELTDLTAMAMTTTTTDESDGEDLQRAMYPSAGGCDEYISIFMHERRVTRQQLNEWQGKLTGLRDEGEKITLKLVAYDQLWRYGARDAKTLAACALYDGLRRAKRI